MADLWNDIATDKMEKQKRDVPFHENIQTLEELKKKLGYSNKARKKSVLNRSDALEIHDSDLSV